MEKRPVCIVVLLLFLLVQSLAIAHLYEKHCAHENVTSGLVEFCTPKVRLELDLEVKSEKGMEESCSGSL